MAQSKSSHRWLREHFNDRYVKEAQKQGWRSRASFKLIELNKKDRFLKPGHWVVDLGSAPGGWSQVAVREVGQQGRVIASDLLPMETLDQVEFVQGDFSEASVLQEIQVLLGQRGADLVISDMAPNMSGISGVDQPRAMYLVELALDMACTVLKPGGAFVCKVFQGEGFDPLVVESRRKFQKVLTRKPEASRPRSREVYLVAKGLK